MRRPALPATLAAFLTLAVALSLWLPGLASASNTTAALTGSVKDPDGNPVAGAEIELRYVEFGTRQQIKTDKHGRFSQFGLRPGAWELTARKEGFADTKSPVILKLGERPDVDIVIVPSQAAAPAPAETTFSVGGAKLSKEAAEAYQAAQDSMARGDKAAARQNLAQVISLAPELPQPYFLLGQLEREAGESAPALEHLRKGLELKPDEALAWIALGEIQLDARQADDSLASFRKATELAPADPRGWKKVAMALVTKGDFAAAVEPLEKYLALAPDAADAAEKRTLLEEVRKLAQKGQAGK